MAGLVLAIVFSAPVSAQQGGSVSADVVLQVQQLQEEIRELRGLIESQSFEIETLKAQQRDQYLDLDRRINDLNNGDVATTESAVSGSDIPLMGIPDQGPDFEVGRTAEDQPAADDPAPAVVVAPEVATPRDSASETAPLDRRQAEATVTGVQSGDEKPAYDRAFQHLKELRYAEAAEGFAAFLDRYPDSEYADNAQYWLGESYYVTRNYDLALDAFNQLLERYSGSPKVADAMLKIGYTHYELENWDQARDALRQVQADYPNTTLARLAENRLRALRLEGHF